MDGTCIPSNWHFCLWRSSTTAHNRHCKIYDWTLATTFLQCKLKKKNFFDRLIILLFLYCDVFGDSFFFCVYARAHVHCEQITMLFRRTLRCYFACQIKCDNNKTIYFTFAVMQFTLKTFFFCHGKKKEFCIFFDNQQFSFLFWYGLVCELTAPPHHTMMMNRCLFLLSYKNIKVRISMKKKFNSHTGKTRIGLRRIRIRKCEMQFGFVC